MVTKKNSPLFVLGCVRGNPFFGFTVCHESASRSSGQVTPDRRQSKTLLIIDERGSKIARNSVFNCHLSP